MTGQERYLELTERTDPNDPLVVEEIKQGIRQSDGLTDIQAHLPTLKRYAVGPVLEIGTRYGTSSAALLAGIEETGGHLYSVDMKRWVYLPTNPRWTFIERDSKDVEYLNKILPAYFNLLFIDGDHSYEGCLVDLENFGSRAHTVILHDAANTSTPGIIQAIGAYLQNSKRHTTCTIHAGSHGLAVIQ